jgi:transcriptional regulator with XRE-family HTH domain
MQHVHVENITNQQVGARIAHVRGEIKMTQADLASEMSARLGREIRPLTVTRLEGGKRPIGVDELVAAAEALQVKPEDLLTDGALPIGTVWILSAYKSLIRARNQLDTAVQQYDSAQRHLREVVNEKGDQYLDRLPLATRVSVDAAHKWTVQEILEYALNEEGGGDDAEA